MAAVLCVGAVSMLAFELFPIRIISIFGSEDGLYNEFAVLCFRIFLSSVILCSVVKASSIFLQALGKPIHSMALSLLREFILCVPLIIILPSQFGLMGTLFSAPIADIVSLVVAVALIKIVFAKMSVELTIQAPAAVC